jgi:hypothetical protein
MFKPLTDAQRQASTEALRGRRAEKQRQADALLAFDTLKPTFCDAGDVDRIFADAARVPARAKNPGEHVRIDETEDAEEDKLLK